MRKLLLLITLFTISVNTIADDKTLSLLGLATNKPSEIPREVLGERNAKRNILKYLGVFTFNHEGRVGACSMEVIFYKGKQRMMTAAHCCVGESEVVKILKVNAELDLCEIQTKATPPFKGGIKLSNKPIKLLDVVYSAGFLIGEGVYFGKGYVRQIFTGLIVSTSYLKPGMSGGPTLDEDGNLIGINSRYNLENNNALFVPSDVIKEFLK